MDRVASAPLHVAVAAVAALLAAYVMWAHHHVAREEFAWEIEQRRAEVDSLRSRVQAEIKCREERVTD